MAVYLYVYTDNAKYTMVYDGARIMALASCKPKDQFVLNVGVAVALQKFCLHQYTPSAPNVVLKHIGTIIIEEDMIREIRRKVPQWISSGYTLDHIAEYIRFSWTQAEPA